MPWYTSIKKKKYATLQRTRRIKGGGRHTPPETQNIYIGVVSSAIAQAITNHKSYIDAAINGKVPFTEQTHAEHCAANDINEAETANVIREAIELVRDARLNAPEPAKKPSQRPAPPSSGPDAAATENARPEATQATETAAVLSRLAVEPKTNPPPAPSSSLRKAAELLKARGLTIGNLERNHQYYQALYRRLGLDPTKAPSVTIIPRGDQAKVTTTAFGQHQVHLPHPAKGSQTPRSPAAKPRSPKHPTQKATPQDNSTFAGELGKIGHGLLFGYKSKPARRSAPKGGRRSRAKTAGQILTKHVLGYTPKRITTTRRKPAKTMTAQTIHSSRYNQLRSHNSVNQDQFEHLTRQAYSRAFLDTVKAQNRKRYDELATHYQELHKATKQSLSRYQAHTATNNAASLSLHARLTGRLSERTRQRLNPQKLNPQKLGIFDHDPKATWQQDIASIHARIVQHGARPLETSLQRELKNARRAASKAQVELDQSSAWSLSANSQANRNRANKALKRAKARIDGINTTFAKIALLEALV